MIASMILGEKKIYSFLILILLFYIIILCVFGLDTADSGFTLSFVARLKVGQIMYKDFDAVRPFSSIILWDLVLKFFDFQNKYLLLISRILVVAELLLISVISQRIFLSNKGIFLLTTFIFLTISHTFNIMPWHTLDGILFGLLSIFFYKKKYFLTSICFAVFCLTTKQSFYFFGIIVSFFNFYSLYKNGIKVPKKDLLLSLSLFVVFVMLLFYYQIPNNFLEFTYQIKASSNIKQLIETGIKSYFFKSYYLNIIFILFLALLLIEKRVFTKKNIFILSFILILSLYLVPIFNKSQYILVNQYFVLLFVVFMKYNRRSDTQFLLFVLAWCSSLSWGYNQPLLLIGILFLMTFQSFLRNIEMLIVNFYLLIIILYLRLTYPYFNEGISKIPYKFCDDIPVVSGIYMSVDTYNYLKDANQLKQKYKNVVFLPGSPILDIITNSMENRASWEMDVEYPSFKSDLKNQTKKNIVYLIEKKPIVPFENGFFKSTFTNDILISKRRISQSYYFYIYQ